MRSTSIQSISGRLARSRCQGSPRIELKDELTRLLSDALKNLAGGILSDPVDPVIDQHRAQPRFQPRRLHQQHRAAAGQAGAAPSARAGRGDRRGAAAEHAARARRSRRRRLHQLPPRAWRARGRAAAGVAAGRALRCEHCRRWRTSPARIRVRESHRAAARRTRAPGRLRGYAREPAAPPCGYQVQREYYINDAGRQMDILTVSTWIRYLEHCGETLAFPSNGYRGDYVHAIAEQLHRQRGDELQRPAAVVVAGLPADAPEGDKEQHVDALIERMRSLLGADTFAAGTAARADHDAGRYPRRPGGLRRRIRSAGTPSAS